MHITNGVACKMPFPQIWHCGTSDLQRSLRILPVELILDCRAIRSPRESIRWLVGLPQGDRVFLSIA